jgi:putative phosphoesterase
MVWIMPVCFAGRRPWLDLPQVAEARGIVERAGILGDIHAEDGALEAALRVFAQEGADAVLCVGDVVDGPGDPNRCCALLEDAGVLTVRGNHDRWALAGEMRQREDATPPEALSERSRRFLEALPATMEVETAMGRLLLCHGMGDDDMAALEPETSGYSLQAIPTLRELMLRRDLALCVGGHTHKRMVRAFQGLLVINPGTLLRTHEPGFAMADLRERSLRFYDVMPGGEVQPGLLVELPRPPSLPPGV